MFFHAAILSLVKAIYLPVPSGHEIRNKELGIRKLKQFYFACPADASRTGFAVSILFRNIAIN